MNFYMWDTIRPRMKFGRRCLGVFIFLTFAVMSTQNEGEIEINYSQTNTTKIGYIGFDDVPPYIFGSWISKE